MEFFEWILNNSIFSIIIFGILVNIFKRFKEATKVVSKNQPTKNTQSAHNLDIPVLVQKRDNKVIDQWTAHQNEDTKQTHSTIKKQSNRVKNTAIEQKTKRGRKLLTSKQKLVEGIIWSEILAPPKALKHKQRRI
jgi:hypothetical protein